MALPSLEGPANKQQAKQNRKTFYEENKGKLVKMAFDYGVSEDELLDVIEKETGGSFSPAQKNFGGGGARGLIQFLAPEGKDVKKIGGKEYKISDIENMDDAQQLELVDLYFKDSLKNSGQEKFQKGELGLAVAAPAFIGKTNAEVQKWAKDNPGKWEKFKKNNPGWVGEDGKMSKQTITDFYTGEKTIREQQEEEIAKKFEEKEKEEKDLTVKDVAKGGARTVLKQVFGPMWGEYIINKVGLEGSIIKKILDKPNEFEKLTKEAKEEVILDVAEENPGEYDEIAETVAQERVNQRKDLVNISEEELMNQEIDKIKVRLDKTKTEDIDVPKMQTETYLKRIDNITPITLDPRTGQEDIEQDLTLPEQPDPLEPQVFEEEEEKKPGVVDKKTKWWKENKGLLGNLAHGALGLLAGAKGIKHMKEALEDIPIEEGPKLDTAWQAHMSKMREMAQSGLTSEEKAAAQADLSKNYNLGVRNVMRAAGGSRAMFLANTGVLNANRVEGLLKLSAADAAMQRENMKNYGKSLQYQQEHGRMTGEIDRKMAYDEAGRKSNLHGQIGNALIETALDSVNYAMGRQSQSGLMDSYKKLFEQQNIGTDVKAADASLTSSSITTENN